MKRQTRTAFAGALGMLLLIFHSEIALSGAAEGIGLCIKTLIPSLYPFFVLSGLLTSALGDIQFGWLKGLEKWIHIPEGGGQLLFLGFFSGYPVGAANVCGCYRKNQLSEADAQCLIGICNHAGPSFLFGVLSGQFSGIGTVCLLWLIQIAGALLTSKLTAANPGHFIHDSSRQTVSPAKVIHQANRSMASVCGWVIIFRVLFEFLEIWLFPVLPELIQIIITGLLELSNGCLELYRIPQEGLRFTVASILLSFGGLCVLLQTASVCDGISMTDYCRIKCIQSIICGLLSLCVQIIFRPDDRFFAPIPLIIIPLLLLLMGKRRKKSSSIPAAYGV